MTLRFSLSFVTLAVLWSAAANAQAHAHPGQPANAASATPAGGSAAGVASFEQLKALAGDWISTTANAGGDSGTFVVAMHVTSRGNLLTHDLRAAHVPKDPTAYDHPITTFFVDSARLRATHYCDAGNRPSFVATTSADGKRLDFDFTSLSGGNDYGHMQHVVFTFVDANHHLEDWAYMLPNGQIGRAHYDLRRADAAPPAPK